MPSTKRTGHNTGSAAAPPLTLYLVGYLSESILPAFISSSVAERRRLQDQLLQIRDTKGKTELLEEPLLEGSPAR